MSSWVPLVAGVVVGLAFVVAGASKLVAGPAWVQQGRDLGAPAAVLPVVPWIELAVGAALAVGLVTPVPALIAALLLVVFTVLIVARLAAGERPACACFGAWSAKPIGAGHVVRNVVLLALAVLSVWR